MSDPSDLSADPALLAIGYSEAIARSAIQEAVQEEHRRIARDLHDHAGQYLVGIALRLAALELRIADPSLTGSFADLRQLLRRLGDELTAVWRCERRGVPRGCELVAALTELTAQWQRDTGIAVEFDTESTDWIEPGDATAEVVFRVAEEALTNIAKHAANASQVQVRLESTPNFVKLVIADDGPGLNTSAEGVDGPHGSGLANMRERLAERGGELMMRCPETGGTCVVAAMPTETRGTRRSSRP